MCWLGPRSSRVSRRLRQAALRYSIFSLSLQLPHSLVHAHTRTRAHTHIYTHTHTWPLPFSTLSLPREVAGAAYRGCVCVRVCVCGSQALDVQQTEAGVRVLLK